MEVFVHADAPFEGRFASLTRRDFFQGIAVFVGLALTSKLQGQSPAVAELEPEGILAIIGLDLAKSLYDKLIDHISDAALGLAFREPSITDEKAWVEGAISSIEARLDRIEKKIDQDRLADMQSKLTSITSMLAEFGALDPRLQLARSSVPMLDAIDSQSAELLSQCRQYDQSLTLASVVLANRLICRYALLKNDTANGFDGRGRISTLISTQEMSGYFGWAIAARARLVDGLAPKYRFDCRFKLYTAHADCDIYRNDVKTTMNSTSDSVDVADREQSLRSANNRAWLMLHESQNFRSEVLVWKQMNVKSRDAISSGANCVARVYRAACGAECPSLFQTQALEIPNTSSLVAVFDGSRRYDVRFPPI